MIARLMLSGLGVQGTILLSTNWAARIMFRDPDAAQSELVFDGGNTLHRIDIRHVRRLSRPTLGPAP